MKLSKEDLFRKYPNLALIRHKDGDQRNLHISYSNRSSRLSQTEIQAVYDFFPFYAFDYTKDLRDKGKINLNDIFKRHFSSDNKILSLEIGFGQAENVLELARRNPSVNYFAVDVFLEGFSKAIKIASCEKLKNILFCHYDALDLINKSLDANSLDFLYVLFPDPWPKNKQKKRRLLNQDNLKTFSSLLRSNGKFIFATDIEDYALTVECFFDSSCDFKRLKDDRLLKSLRPVETHYEKKAKEEGRQIYNLVYIKDYFKN